MLQSSPGPPTLCTHLCRCSRADDLGGWPGQRVARVRSTRGSTRTLPSCLIPLALRARATRCPRCPGSVRFRTTLYLTRCVHRVAGPQGKILMRPSGKCSYDKGNTHLFEQSKGFSTKPHDSPEAHYLQIILSERCGMRDSVRRPPQLGEVKERV